MPAHRNYKLKIPASSLGQRIEQDFGLGVISIKYYRPNTKGRKIFNGMEPYGIVWRTGANNATVVTLTDTVQVEGHTLAPGSYSLLAYPVLMNGQLYLIKPLTSGALTHTMKNKTCFVLK